MLHVLVCARCTSDVVSVFGALDPNQNCLLPSPGCGAVRVHRGNRRCRRRMLHG